MCHPLPTLYGYTVGLLDIKKKHAFETVVNMLLKCSENAVKTINSLSVFESDIEQNTTLFECSTLSGVV